MEYEVVPVSIVKYPFAPVIFVEFSKDEKYPVVDVNPPANHPVLKTDNPVPATDSPFAKYPEEPVIPPLNVPVPETVSVFTFAPEKLILEKYPVVPDIPPAKYPVLKKYPVPAVNPPINWIL